MPSPIRDFLTVEQLAERWGLDEIDIQQLILTRRLPQAFLVSGRARLVRNDPSGATEIHQLTADAPVQMRLLVSTIDPTQDDPFCWSLRSVRRVYEFIVETRNQPNVLLALCSAAQDATSGWSIEFERQDADRVGKDLVHEADLDLRESGFIAIDTVFDLEQALHIAPRANGAPEKAPSLHELRRQRCRAVAQILWERDPRATVPDVYRSEWVQRIACEAHPPTEKTFREWVKDLNPNRSPGRRSV